MIYALVNKVIFGLSWRQVLIHKKGSLSYAGSFIHLIEANIERTALTGFNQILFLTDLLTLHFRSKSGRNPFVIGLSTRRLCIPKLTLFFPFFDI